MANTMTVASVMSDDDWAKRVADDLKLTDPVDVQRVLDLLVDAHIRVARPRSPHRLQMRSMYVAGIKRWHPEDRGTTDKTVPYTRTPFSFAHTFADGVTIFATDGENNSGKSTILGVLLWALRGVPPDVTLQSDIRETWMREAAVVFQIDGTTFVTCWRSHAGLPVGGIYILESDEDLSVEGLRVGGLATATKELQETEVREAATGAGDADDSESVSDDDDGVVTPVTDVVWPGVAACEQLVTDGEATPYGKFESAAQFRVIVEELMLSRLEMDPLRNWRKNKNAADASDGKVTTQGWPTFSHALAIEDPTIAVVLGEEAAMTQHLMAVYLGSRWAQPAGNAKRVATQVEAELASVRRRREADRETNDQDLKGLEAELKRLTADLAGLDQIPAFDVVHDAVAEANSTAIAASKAQARLLEAAAAYGVAATDLATLQRDLQAMKEARATSRFFHALKPSCCPRCDAQIDSRKWSRESDGHCSLCDEKLGEAPIATVASPVEEFEDAHDDEEDSLTTMEAQIVEFTVLVDELSGAHDIARDEKARLEDAATAAAEALAAMDQVGAAGRYDLETQISRLLGRIEERQGLNIAQANAGTDDREFVSRVYRAAEKIAKVERDLEQRATVAIVSDVVTDLGVKFGIRNLERATFQANGHLPVLKGGQEKPSPFSKRNVGERLRLKIATVVGLLTAGQQTGTGRHPGLLIIDDLTTHEINPEDAASMAEQLATIPNLQVITASTMGPRLQQAVGEDRVVMPPPGEAVLF